MLFGSLLSSLFAISILLLQENLENELVGNTLKKELDSYMIQLREDPTVVEPFYSRIEGYITRPGDASIVPRFFVTCLPANTRL